MNVDPDKSFRCVYFVERTEYCEAIGHFIMNGYATLYHCTDCSLFKERVVKDETSRS
jgi:hypothetical protein